MKYFIKHKLLLVVAAVIMGLNLSVGSVLALHLPETSLLAQTITCAPGTKLNNKDDTLCCPAGQLPAQVHGQGVQRSCCPNTQAFQQAKNDGEKAKACLFGKYLNPVINLLSAIVAIVVVIGVIVGAIQFSSSSGDPQKAANGKEHIRNALIGLLAYILLYAFLQYIIPGGRLN